MRHYFKGLSVIQVVVYIFYIALFITGIVGSVSYVKSLNSEEAVHIEYTGTEPVYLITIEVRQSHPATQIVDNISDKFNAITIELPVEKWYYDSVETGTILDNSFRTASFVTKGSLGSWKITVKSKETLNIDVGEK